jgi:uncharacterized RDD family membrane protein YckC
MGDVMKCPKCNYLGFETGDRCKNCGYDFSLLALADPTPHPDLMLRPRDDEASDQLGAIMAAEVADDPRIVDPPLPLFSRAAPRDDEPLIKVPAVPRAPLSVRRTPDAPRPRGTSTTARSLEDEASLEFPEPARPRVIVPPSTRPGTSNQRPLRDASGAVPRAVAALIDIAILAAIDLAVVYFTLRMAGLTMGNWRLLPPVPMLAFLMIVKLAYYSGFTAVGGQTIGKMATRIRVVTEDDGYVEPSMAVQRTLAAIASVVTLGAAFVPALLGTSRRAFHDRVAHTRVVALPPA